MKKSVVNDAKAAVSRLLEKIEAMEQLAGVHNYRNISGNTHYNSGQYTAAVRRASMDLTRALAAVRRGF